MLVKDSYQTLDIDGDGANSGEEVDADGVNSDEKVYEATHLTFEEAYRPQKFISFHENVGQNNFVDFIAGINLKNISRNLETNNFTTKLIVKNNNNKFAPSGSCNIARATENPIGDNFLINFDYYIKMGLLNYENFYNDLYSMSSNRGWLGYYTRLKSINTELLRLTEELVALSAKISKYESDYQVASEQFEATVEELRDSEDLFKSKTTFTFDEIDEDSNWLKENEIIALGEKILQLRDQSKKIQEEYIQAEQRRNKLNASIEVVNQSFNEMLEQKNSLNTSFEKKYSRFIQEAPWSSEDYMDDNLYYLDAESTLHNSASPKVSYTINVVDLSLQEDFENYTYSLGDITHMQDTEFFGYTYSIIDGQEVRTPYREKIVVTETTTNFEEPEKDTIKVQNFRTQFEDLFQRMAATTQKVEFYAGSYEKAADVVEANGQISTESLRDAFSNNAYILQNANNQSVKWTDAGIIAKNLNSPNEIVRIVSGGVFITEDGGSTWSAGMTGRGINAKAITTGSLNTGLITIMDDSQPAFRWDKTGLSAYKKESNGVYNNQTYVRYDQFGLYGVRGLLNAPTSLEEVWDNSLFALTWKGFKLKTGNENGSVEISTDNDFIMRNSEGDPIVQIGRIQENGKEVYGLTIGTDDNVFKATQNSLTIAGWTARAGAFTGEYTDENGNIKAVALYSNPQESNGYFITAGPVNEPLFSVDYSGAMNATSGKIGGWNIGEKALYVEKLTRAIEEEDRYNFYFGPGAEASLGLDGASRGSIVLKVGDNFGVTSSGEMYAFKGRIGGWNLEEASLFTGDGTFYLGVENNDSGYILQVGDNFGISKNGHLYTNSLEATSGTIGGWKLGNGVLSFGSAITLGQKANSDYVLFTDDVTVTAPIERYSLGEELRVDTFIINPEDKDVYKIEHTETFPKVGTIPFVDNLDVWIHGGIVKGKDGKVDFEASVSIAVNETDNKQKIVIEGSEEKGWTIKVTFSIISKEVPSEVTANVRINTATNPSTSTAPGLAITSEGQMISHGGIFGGWTMNELLKSPRKRVKNIYGEIILSGSGLEYNTYSSSGDTEPASTTSISWSDFFIKLSKI